jgi:hypothetical protein
MRPPIPVLPIPIPIPDTDTLYTGIGIIGIIGIKDPGALRRRWASPEAAAVGCGRPREGCGRPRGGCGSPGRLRESCEMNKRCIGSGRR